MNNMCTCGHMPDEHDGEKGRCEGDCVDVEYGRFHCLCHAYTKDTDD